MYANTTKNLVAKLSEAKEICRFCLNIDDVDFINASDREIIQIVAPQVDLNISKNPGICKACTKLLQQSFAFKSKCFEIEDNIHDFKNDDDQVNLEKILGIVNNSGENCVKVCRTCLVVLENNTFTEVQQESGLKTILERCIPEMDIKLTLDPVICQTCEIILKKLFDFIDLCKSTEEKIKFSLANGEKDNKNNQQVDSCQENVENEIASSLTEAANNTNKESDGIYIISDSESDVEIIEESAKEVRNYNYNIRKRPRTVTAYVESDTSAEDRDPDYDIETEEEDDEEITFIYKNPKRPKVQHIQQPANTTLHAKNICHSKTNETNLKHLAHSHPAPPPGPSLPAPNSPSLPATPCSAPSSNPCSPPPQSSIPHMQNSKQIYCKFCYFTTDEELVAASHVFFCPKGPYAVPEKSSLLRKHLLLPKLDSVSKTIADKDSSKTSENLIENTTHGDNITDDNSISGSAEIKKNYTRVLKVTEDKPKSKSTSENSISGSADILKNYTPMLKVAEDKPKSRSTSDNSISGSAEIKKNSTGTLKVAEDKPKSRSTSDNSISGSADILKNYTPMLKVAEDKPKSRSTSDNSISGSADILKNYTPMLKVAEDKPKSRSTSDNSISGSADILKNYTPMLKVAEDKPKSRSTSDNSISGSADILKNYTPMLKVAEDKPKSRSSRKRGLQPYEMIEAMKVVNIELRRRTEIDDAKQKEVELAITNNKKTVFKELSIFVCNYCDFNSRSAPTIFRHRTSHPSNTKKKVPYMGEHRTVFFCVNCTKQYKTPTNLRFHTDKCERESNENVILFRVGEVWHCTRCCFDSNNKKLAWKHLLDGCGPVK